METAARTAARGARGAEGTGESKHAPPPRREVPLGRARWVQVWVTTGAQATGAEAGTAAAPRRGLALRGTDVATGRHVVWVAGNHHREYVPGSALAHDWRPATVPLPCEVAVWALRGGGREAAMLVGYENDAAGGGERAMAVPWGHVEQGDATVVDTARRVLFEHAGVLAGPDDTFRVAHFDCERGGTLRGGAAARVVMALHMDGLTETVAAPGMDTTTLRGLAMRGVGDLADQEGLGQRMAWGAALATQCLGEGAGSHDKAREVLD